MKQLFFIAVIMLLGLVYTAGNDPPLQDQPTIEIVSDDATFSTYDLIALDLVLVPNPAIQMEAERPEDKVSSLLSSNAQGVTINKPTELSEIYMTRPEMHEFICSQEPGMV